MAIAVLRVFLRKNIHLCVVSFNGPLSLLNKLLVPIKSALTHKSSKPKHLSHSGLKMGELANCWVECILESQNTKSEANVSLLHTFPVEFWAHIK